MSMRQWRLVALGFPVWGVGLYLLADGSWVLGGALMLLGGLFLVIAASGGWVEFWQGLSNWLYFWR